MLTENPQQFHAQHAMVFLISGNSEAAGKLLPLPRIMSSFGETRLREGRRD
jgi:hypothetical protein